MTEENVLLYAERENIMYHRQAAELGYAPFTTFYLDLSIAECYGIDAIRDTFNKVKDEWLKNYKYWTEFVLCVNWKSWEWADRNNVEFGQLYADLYYGARKLFYDKYENDEEACRYFFEVTD
jgi:hypothetical protein